MGRTARVLVTLTEDDDTVNVLMDAVGLESGWGLEVVASALYGDGEGVEVADVKFR